MIRVIAFVIALSCCIGLISGTHNALTDAGDDLIFTEEVLYGDGAVLDGRVICSSIECGDHMTWNTTYTFGEEDRFDTEFVFTQEKRTTETAQNWNTFEVYATNGFGASTTGSFDLRNTAGGDMIRAVAAVTPDGEEKQMNLSLKNYTDYHLLDFELSYSSDAVFCDEWVSATDHIFAQWDHDPVDFETYVKDVSPSYLDFCELFKFPVQDDEIVSVVVEKDFGGGICSLDYNTLNSPEIRFVTAVNDSGAYCIPVYVKDGNAAEALPGEYAYGMGIYFIPWKFAPGAYARSDGETARSATLDVENAENIYPLPETTIVYGLEVDEEAGTAWMLSLEEGVYVLTQLDLGEAAILRRLEVVEADVDAESYYPTWHCRESVMLVEVCGNLALVDLTGEPEVDFVIALGETREGFYYFSSDSGGLWYDGKMLILTGCRYYDEKALTILACDASGPLYWGEFGCSIFEGNEPGCSPYIQNGEGRMTIE